MTEIREIREKLYQKMKDMTHEEQAEYIKKGAESAMKEFGLNLPRWKKADEPIPTKVNP